jgi:sugar phosphate isomerase/epimerase
MGSSAPGGPTLRRDAVFVACSTLSFARYPLDQALRTIVELGFGKADIAIHEHGPHLRPSQVAADVHQAMQSIRIGPGLTPAAFSIMIDAADPAEFQTQFRAVCRLACLSTISVVSLPAAPAGVGLDAEVERLTRLVQISEKEGVLLGMVTEMGTVTEEPAAAFELCQRVPGLGLTLDPSHYIAGQKEPRDFDMLYPYIRHVRLRDTGRGPNQFQVRVGQGEVEYGRIVSQLARHRYDRLLTVDIRDVPDSPFAMEPEVRKLKYLLESLV